MERVAALRCYLLPAKIDFCSPSYYAQHEKAYRFWHHNIQSALQEEKNNEIAKQLGSDLFFENDEMVVLFDEGHPIGLFMFRWINRRFLMNRELSALTHRFPSNLFTSLAEKNLYHVMLMAHLSVHPAWRKSVINAGISDLLVNFSLKRLLESKGDVLITTTRNNRGTNTLGFRHGAVKYADAGKVFNVASDIIVFYRDRVKPIESPALQAIADHLWQTKQIGIVEQGMASYV